MTPVVLSYGLGVDSTAILLRWLHEPATRDFDLSDLTVVTAMTGDEWEHTKSDVEAYVLPLFRQHGIRYIQVARGGRYVTKDGTGVHVLDDSTDPQVLHLAGDYKLSEEMLTAATVPQSGGARLCSVHAKGDVLDPVIAGVVGDQPYRHVVGFEANETSRARKDTLFNTAQRTGEYPLIDWNWDRQACLDYIQTLVGIEWQKSACVYCPFSLQNKASIARQLELYRRYPERAAEALYMEEVALSLNPSQSLIPKKPLLPILVEARLNEAIELYQKKLQAAPHAIYEVRRILRPRKDDPTKLANAARSIRKVQFGTRGDLLHDFVRQIGRPLPADLDSDGIWRAHVRRRGSTFPTTEHFFALAPADADNKQHDRFEDWWHDATGEDNR